MEVTHTTGSRSSVDGNPHPAREPREAATTVGTSEPGDPPPQTMVLVRPGSPRGSKVRTPATRSACRLRLFDAAPEADSPAEPPPRPVALARKRSTWRSDLRSVAVRCEGLARELGALSRVAVSGRSPAAVRDAVGRLRRVVDELDQIAADLSPD